ESLSLGIVRVPGLTLQNYFYIGTVYLNSRIRLSGGMIKNVDSDGSGIINCGIKIPIGENGFLTGEGFYILADEKDREFSYLTEKRYEILLGCEIYFGTIEK
ncbi:MAG: hypothetical protein ACP5QJ_07500, partial [Thermosulfidibacteraceae bacterium]